MKSLNLTIIGFVILFIISMAGIISRIMHPALIVIFFNISCLIWFALVIHITKEF